MPRVKRKQLKFDDPASADALLQEIYNESHNIKAKISMLFTKWEKYAKEGGEIAILGEQIVKLIAAEAKNQDQKIMILKFLKEVVYKDKGKDTTTEGGEVVYSKERRSALLSMVKEGLDGLDKKGN